MQEIEYILDFAVNLAKQMLQCGANLERVNTTIYRICQSYDLHSVSVFSLSSVISASARTADGVYAVRQVSIPVSGIHLERLKSLNRLSYRVCSEKTPPKELERMLEEAGRVKEYSEKVTVIGYLIAIACVCAIFGGSVKDVIAVDIVTFVLVWMIKYFNRPGIDRIVTNLVCMWIATTLSVILVKVGLGDRCSIVIISVNMVVIPGIPLVNAVRNLFCNNEMNGIMQLLKVVLESISMALGIYLSLSMFGGMVKW